MMALVDVSKARGCMGWPCGQEHSCAQLKRCGNMGQAARRARTGGVAHGRARAQRVPNLFIVNFGTHRVIATRRMAGS